MTLTTPDILLDRLTSTCTPTMMEEMAQFLEENPWTSHMIVTGQMWFVTSSATNKWCIVGKDVPLYDAIISLNNCG